MKQTAVEFLMDKLFDPSTMVQEQIEWFEQAKQMEKEQTLKFGIKCQLDFIKSDGIRSVEDLYESTFNQQTK